MFELGSEYDDGEDDNFRAWASDDDHARGSNSSLDASWPGYDSTENFVRPMPLQRMTSTYRRWSAAVAGIPDDGDFLRELDRRLECGGASSIGIHDAEDVSTDDGLDPHSSGRWHGARRSMLCVREIVRTERSYLDHLMRCRESEVCAMIL